MRLFICLICLLLPFHIARAAVALGDACTQSGELGVYNAANGLIMLKCDGAVWQKGSIMMGDSSPTCNSNNEGAVSYNKTTGAWTFCNATSFVDLKAVNTVSQPLVKSSTDSANGGGTASCSAPSCGAGYTSGGCQSVTYTGTYVQLQLVKQNLANAIASSGFSGSCSASQTHASNPSTVACGRFCVPNS